MFPAHKSHRKTSYIITFTGALIPEEHTWPLSQFLELAVFECLPPMKALAMSCGGSYSRLLRECSPIILYPHGILFQMSQKSISRPWGVQLPRCNCGVHTANWSPTEFYNILKCRTCGVTQKAEKPNNTYKTISSLFYQIPLPPLQNMADESQEQ